jgi:hypothetical protein
MELHNYQNSATNCGDITGGLNNNGYNAMNVSNTAYYHVPIVLTEFGFNQQDGSYNGVYAQCLKQFITGQPGGPGGWMQWVLSGSYYIREGTQDFEETWGKLMMQFGCQDILTQNRSLQPRLVGLERSGCYCVHEGICSGVLIDRKWRTVEQGFISTAATFLPAALSYERSFNELPLCASQTMLQPLRSLHYLAICAFALAASFSGN